MPRNSQRQNQHQNGKNFQNKNGQINHFAHSVAISVPVTSRSVGFCTAEVYESILNFSLTYDYQCQSSIHKMYRVFLALFQGKVCAVSRAFGREIASDEEMYSQLGVIKSLVSACGVKVPSAIATLIRAVGKIQTDGKEFIPFVAPNNYTPDGTFIPQSEHVYLYNLRQTVLALQNPATAVEYRCMFYKHNPIPGTVWRNVPDNPILINADEIIPSDYNVKTHLFNEFLQVEEAMKSDSVYRGSDSDDDADADYRLPFKSEYINLAGLTVEPGVKSLLMCNRQIGVKISDKSEDEDSRDYRPMLREERCHFKHDSQNLVEFTESDVSVIKETIRKADRCYSFEFLLGERPLIPSLCYPHYMTRDFLACCQYFDGLVTKVIAVPITTRSIGFGTVKIFQNLWNLLRPLEGGNMYQVYRTCLYLIQLKILNAKINSRYLPENMADYQSHLNRTWTSTAYNYPRFILAPLADIINTVGLLEAEGKVFLPVVVKDNRTETGGFIPQSEHVFLYNLRDTVEALADENTPSEHRRSFYENNAIPGTIWQDAPDNPILVNADDVIPKGYCENDLLDDFDGTNLVMSIIGKIKPKLERQPIEVNTRGTKEMLTCNDQNKMRVTDRLANDRSYLYRLKIEGDVDVFHNYVRLTSDEQIYANTFLLGERPVVPAHSYPYYVNRDKRVCVEHCYDHEISYTKCCELLYPTAQR